MNDSLAYEWLQQSPVPHSAVRWRADTRWFENRVRADAARAPLHRGCCPAAVALHGSRPGFRCCGHKLHKLLPLRPESDVTWEEAAQWLPSGMLLLLNGDSMVEQQLVGLLCSAWSTPGFEISVPVNWQNAPSFHNKDVDGIDKVGMRGVVVGEVRASSSISAAGWRLTLATVDLFHVSIWGTGKFAYAPSLRAALTFSGTPIGNALGQTSGSSPTPDAPWTHLRPEVPRLRPTLCGGRANAEEIVRRLSAPGSMSAAALLANASALIIGGWHHALPQPSALAGLLRDLRTRLAPGLPSLLVEALPPHFPGGRYLAHASLPAVCPHAHCLPSSGRYEALPVCSSEPPHHRGASLASRCRYPEAVPPGGLCDQWPHEWPDAAPPHSTAPTPPSLTAEHAQDGASLLTLPVSLPTTTLRMPTFIRGIGNEWLQRFNAWLLAAAAAEGALDMAHARSWRTPAKGKAVLTTVPSQFRLLRVASLYAGRGEAHVEHAGAEGAAAGSPRDCLHYCVAPGVLDALALETLSALATIAPQS